MANEAKTDIRAECKVVEAVVEAFVDLQTALVKAFNASLALMKCTNLDGLDKTRDAVLELHQPIHEATRRLKDWMPKMRCEIEHWNRQDAKAPKPAAAPAPDNQPRVEGKAQSMPCRKNHWAGLTRMLPYLYQGNSASAGNKAELQRLGIKRILNCTSSQNAFPDDFVYTNMSIGGGPLAPWLDKSFALISECKSKNERLLVHCDDGRATSPSLVMAYMMQSAAINLGKYLPLDKVMHYVQQQNKAMRIRDAQLVELHALEMTLFAEFESDEEDETDGKES